MMMRLNPKIVKRIDPDGISYYWLIELKKDYSKSLAAFFFLNS
mgnify:CR=1 FL=1